METLIFNFNPVFTALVFLCVTQVSFAREIDSIFDLKLQALITGAGNIQELVSSLPGEIKERAIYIHDSHSLQNASVSNPRVLFFSRDGRLSFTVSSIGEKKDEIEAIEFSEKKKEFQFYSLRFKSGFLISKRQTSECTRCHGSDLRPNWDPHPRWNGVFGSHKEGLFSSDEIKRLEIFKNSIIKNSIYSSLSQHFFEKNTLSSLSSINHYYTRVISEKNFQRIARILKNTNYFNQFKYAILASLGCSFETAPIHLFPDDWKSEARELRLNLPMAGDQRYDYNLIEWFATYSGIETSKLSMIFDEEKLSKGIPSYWNRYSSGGSTELELAYWLSDIDPELKKWVTTQWRYESLDWRHYYAHAIAPLSHTTCKKLALLSQQEINNVNKSVFLKSDSMTNSLALKGMNIVRQKCMDCHQNDTDSPMGFDPQSVKKWKNENPDYASILNKRLEHTAKKSYRMPRFEKPLTDQESKAVIRYIESI